MGSFYFRQSLNTRDALTERPVGLFVRWWYNHSRLGYFWIRFYLWTNFGQYFSYGLFLDTLLLFCKWAISVSASRLMQTMPLLLLTKRSISLFVRHCVAWNRNTSSITSLFWILLTCSDFQMISSWSYIESEIPHESPPIGNRQGQHW